MSNDTNMGGVVARSVGTDSESGSDAPEMGTLPGAGDGTVVAGPRTRGVIA